MEFAFEIGDKEKFRVVFYRNPFTGRMVVTINDQDLPLENPQSVSTHFSFRLLKHYEFVVGQKEKHQIVIEYRRPFFGAGLRRQKYTVYVDGELLEEHYGF